MTLGVLQALAGDTELSHWDGLGIVIQAYGRRAGTALDVVGHIAQASGRCIAVRLVKGAYWDAEIKTAQEKGLTGFPVYTHKSYTDLAYLRHAHRLFQSESLYPQFATHNAATLSAIETLAADHAGRRFEIQRLHGMGAAVHQAYQAKRGRRLRVYAPVGSHHDLLAYLVRRPLENGAKASFMHQLADLETPIEEIVRDPYDSAIADVARPPGFRSPQNMYTPTRLNSRGWDLDDPDTLASLELGSRSLELPHMPPDASPKQAEAISAEARTATAPWANTPHAHRVALLEKTADLLEANAKEKFELLARETGKTRGDGVGDLREAVDFCRYYAAQARSSTTSSTPRGVVLAISPWNFPLAIFTGQIAAALVAGNTVVAKPAEQTPRIAARVVELMVEAGIPETVVQLICGPGESIGTLLCGAGEADMVVFAGSTQTARHIACAIAVSSRPAAPLLAETGA
jgi:RHH-type transcriptional regulator, proline utilization regulon repressor / proline dehydrogenase / delta 1-pyrroline-5-carboxylate dehydrogenase